jgi:hypothetical protein
VDSWRRRGCNLIITPYETGWCDPNSVLFAVRHRAGRLVEDGEYALQSPLTTGDDNSDSSEAREAMTKAVSATKLLIGHLDERFDFDFDDGSAQPKEEHVEI